MERHKLDEDDIRPMTPHSEKYVIPCLQTHVKRSGLILYRTVNRKEAEHKASSLEENLKIAEFHTQKRVWYNTQDLITYICEHLNTFPSANMSLLFVSIMTHGRAWILIGSDESTIQITNILHLLKRELPEHLPLVRIHLSDLPLLSQTVQGPF